MAAKPAKAKSAVRASQGGKRPFYTLVAVVMIGGVNVFGGFLVTQRMLEMFKKKDKKAGAETSK